MAYRLADVPPSAEGGSTVITLSTEPNTVGTCSRSVPSPAGSSLSARSSLLGAERGGAAQGGLRSSLAPGRRANGSRRACRAQDAGVVDCFLVLAKAADASGESVMLLLRTLRFLRSCQYSEEDICLMLAHASIYPTRTRPQGPT
ncbi:unnamed protein product [Prorocentrum cordatum]|uniref:Uncharacterized protein n=1 Tax=Prorocentrum cordatum TaxID=2364126 RepID=A0ABN9P9C7_9DINO|nr:unnamed protein product [Polarella glacialis]